MFNTINRYFYGFLVILACIAFSFPYSIVFSKESVTQGISQKENTTETAKDTNSLNQSTKEEDKLLFEKLFTEWTEAFNQKDLAKTCALFSKDLIATYRGVPEKNYASICEGFKKIFAEKDKKYQYRYEIHQVYRSLDLAAVRITWYLTIEEPGKKIALVQDEGLDVLQQDKDRQWKIVNFVGFGGK